MSNPELNNEWESSTEPSSENNTSLQAEDSLVILPKFQKKEAPENIWIKSISSLVLYLALGFYIFKQWEILLLITAIVLIHEAGHFLAMKMYHYNDLGIFFIPLLGAYVSGSKREISQKQSAIILLAGPLPGIIIGIILYLLDQYSGSHYFLGSSFSRIGMLFILLNIINLLPIYPLDGGQLLNRVYLNEESTISKIFIFLSIAFLIWVAIKIPFYVLLIFPGMMLLRMFSEKNTIVVEKKIEEAGIQTDLEYRDLPDADYWAIRNILIAEQSSFNHFTPSPPYVYHEKEERMMTAIQQLLHHHLIQDISIIGKIFILLLWLAAIAAPWLLKMEIPFLRAIGL